MTTVNAQNTLVAPAVLTHEAARAELYSMVDVFINDAKVLALETLAKLEANTDIIQDQQEVSQKQDIKTVTRDFMTVMAVLIGREYCDSANMTAERRDRIRQYLENV